jgi:hypothetical protein
MPTYKRVRHHQEKQHISQNLTRILYRQNHIETFHKQNNIRTPYKQLYLAMAANILVTGAAGYMYVLRVITRIVY